MPPKGMLRITVQGLPSKVAMRSSDKVKDKLTMYNADRVDVKDPADPYSLDAAYIADMTFAALQEELGLDAAQMGDQLTIVPKSDVDYATIRAEKKAEVTSRLQEATQMSAEALRLSQETDEAGFQTAFTEIKQRYNFGGPEFGEQTKAVILESLANLKRALNQTLQDPSLSSPPIDLQVKCGSLMANHIPGVVVKKVTGVIPSPISQKDTQDYASDFMRKQHDAQGFATKTTAGWAIGGSAGGTTGTVSGGISGGYASNTQQARDADLSTTSEHHVSTLLCVVKQVHQIYSFKIDEYSLSEDLLVLAEAIADKPDGRKQEEAAFELISRFWARMSRGPYGVGGYFEVVAKSTSSKRVQKNALYDVAARLAEQKFQLGLSLGATSGAASGGIGVGGHSSQSVSAGVGESGGTSEISVNTTTSELICGPAVTIADEFLRLLHLLPNTWQIFPSIQPGAQRNDVTISEALTAEIQRTDNQSRQTKLAAAVRAINRFLDASSEVIPRAILPPGATERNILLFGKTGAGKSLLGNVLLGKHNNIFSVSNLPASCTKGTSTQVSNDNKVRVWDTMGGLDTEDFTGGALKFQEAHRKIAKEIVEIWRAVGTRGIDAILIVVSAAERVGEMEARLAEMAQQLFTGDMKQVLWLVFTKAEGQYLAQDQGGTNARNQWLSTSNNHLHFQKIYNLVDTKPAKCIFINNLNPETTESLLKANEAKKNNVKMSELVLTPVHKSTSQAVTLTEGQLGAKLAGLDAAIAQEQYNHPNSVKARELIAEREKAEKAARELAATKCFAATSIVMVKGRGDVPMAKLAVGDEVMAANDTWVQVTDWIHGDPSAPGRFILLEHPMGVLKASPAHFVFVCRQGNRIAVPACKVKIGDSLIGTSSTLLLVTAIKEATLQGYYAPLTSTGELMVDGVLCSCYVQWAASWQKMNYTIPCWVMQQIMLPLRRCPRRLRPAPHIPNGNIHPYAEWWMKAAIIPVPMVNVLMKLTSILTSITA